MSNRWSTVTDERGAASLRPPDDVKRATGVHGKYLGNSMGGPSLGMELIEALVEEANLWRASQHPGDGQRPTARNDGPVRDWVGAAHKADQELQRKQADLAPGYAWCETHQRFTDTACAGPTCTLTRGVLAPVAEDAG